MQNYFGCKDFSLNIFFLPFFVLSYAELYYDRGNHHEFTSLVKELARPGELTHNQSYSFEFQQVEKPYESYTGANVRLRLVFVCYTVLPPNNTPPNSN